MVKFNCDLSHPLPINITYRQITLRSPYWHCGCAMGEKTMKVLQNGVTVGPTPEPKLNPANASPQEILFYARPYTFLERLMHPLVKQ